MIFFTISWFQEIIQSGKPKYIITEHTPQIILSLLQHIVLGIRRKQIIKSLRLGRRKITGRGKNKKGFTFRETFYHEFKLTCFVCHFEEREITGETPQRNSPIFVKYWM